MAIQSLYKNYIQKSRIFLYPALGIKRGSNSPIEIYAAWEGMYKAEDCKLSCLYHLRNDAEFRAFEKMKLFGNPLFHDFKLTPDDKAVYVFDFSKYKSDWNCFIRGQYSKMSTEHKNKIKAFYGSKSPNYAYIESFLHPDKYFGMYAQMVNVKEEVLKDVGELCDKPDLEKETLNISIKSLEMQRENP
jgi:hypothetical protein